MFYNHTDSNTDWILVNLHFLHFYKKKLTITRSCKIFLPASTTEYNFSEGDKKKVWKAEIFLTSAAVKSYANFLSHISVLSFFFFLSLIRHGNAANLSRLGDYQRCKVFFKDLLKESSFVFLLNKTHTRLFSSKTFILIYAKNLQV